MTDQDRKSRIRENRRKTLFDFKQKSKEVDKSDSFESCRLEEKSDIESHDKIMDSHPNYLIIFYSFVIKYKQILKIFTSTKMKSLIRNVRNNGPFVIVLVIFIVLK
jgi:hypothetical protein